MTIPQANRISSGLGYLDKLSGGLMVGDNVIWQVESGSFVELFYLSFLRASLRARKKVVFVNFNSSPRTVLKRLGGMAQNRDLTLLDCFTSGKGEKSDLFTGFYETREAARYRCRVIHVEEPDRIMKFIGLINRIEESHPKGAHYVFDSLTGLQDLWGSEERAMKLFTHQCPRLYELKTIAYWILEKGAHSTGFLANLSHISQVVIDLSVHDGVRRLTVAKADNRSSSEITKPQQYEVANSKIQFLTPKKGAPDIGIRLKRFRERRALSQADLARKMGVTPSTVSQAESNTISLSLSTLVRLAQVLDVPPGAFFEEEAPPGEEFVFRGSERKPVALTGVPRTKARAEELLPPRLSGGERAYLVHFLPGAKLPRHFLVHKGEEWGYLASGAVAVTVGAETRELKAGDSLFLESEIPAGWHNRGEEMATLVWIVKGKYL